MKTRYFCPVHKDVTLYEEDALFLKMFVFDRPQFCSLCGKSYFKSECVPEIPDLQVEDDEAEG